MQANPKVMVLTMECPEGRLYPGITKPNTRQTKKINVPLPNNCKSNQLVTNTHTSSAIHGVVIGEKPKHAGAGN